MKIPKNLHVLVFYSGGELVTLSYTNRPAAKAFAASVFDGDVPYELHTYTRKGVRASN